MTPADAAIAFLDWRRSHRLSAFNPVSSLPAQQEQIKAGLLEFHASSAPVPGLQAALMDLATFVDDSAAAVANAVLFGQPRGMTSEETAAVRQAVDSASYKQLEWLILLGDFDAKPPLGLLIDRVSERQRNAMQSKYGAIGTYAWIAGCVFKAFTDNGVSTGLGGIAFFFAGMFGAAVIGGAVFNLLQQFLVSRLPKDQIPSWLRPVGLAFRVVEFAVVFMTCLVLFGRVFPRVGV